MPNLYEINKAIFECVDAETGEIIDIEALDALMMERDEKLENVACYIKNLLADADALKAEKDKLADREKRCRSKAESLKKYLSDNLHGAAFSTAKCEISFRRSEAVEVADVTLLPAELLRVKTTYEPKKDAIKAAIKAGQVINGCTLVENLNLQLK